MTPEELEALADRAETGTATVIDVARAIGHRAWVDGPTPDYFTSLDAAAQVMPAGWWVEMTCSPTHARVYCFSSAGKSKDSASAPTECAARVAAGLRARAHVLRNGGAA